VIPRRSGNFTNNFSHGATIFALARNRPSGGFVHAYFADRRLCPEEFGQGLCRRRVSGGTLIRAGSAPVKESAYVLNAMPIVYFLYAAALVGGGMMGSKVSGKSSSLLGSLAFGLVAVAAAMLLKGNPRFGLLLGILNAVAVTGFFIFRYVSTQKVMPAFGAIGLSVVVLILSFVAYSAVSKNSP
jgi:uncharacterized membrane protein (UPF0136 family)